MSIITINGVGYNSYATVDEADAYLGASINYQIWNDLDTDTKGRFLVSASRFLDGLPWKESCLPLSDSAGGNINIATILIAEQLALGNVGITGGSVPEEDIKRYKAGSVELEYQAKPWFISSAQNPYAFMPRSIFNMIKNCLNGVGFTLGGSTSFGTSQSAGPSNYNGDYSLSNF